jgi:hypothetical protein
MAEKGSGKEPKSGGTPKERPPKDPPPRGGLGFGNRFGRKGKAT